MADRSGVKRTLVLGQVVIAAGLIAVNTSGSFGVLIVLMARAGFGYGMVNHVHEGGGGVVPAASARNGHGAQAGRPALRWDARRRRFGRDLPRPARPAGAEGRTRRPEADQRGPHEP